MKKPIYASQSGIRWLWVTILVLGIDRFCKYWAMDNLVLFQPKQILPVFNLTLVYNVGAAFSFLASGAGWQNWFFSLLAALVSIFIIVWLFKIPATMRWLSIALCLIMGGALGNAWDRLQYGFVVDFLSFHYGTWYFAIFNTADAAICVGAFMLFIHWVFFSE